MRPSSSFDQNWQEVPDTHISKLGECQSHGLTHLIAAELGVEFSREPMFDVSQLTVDVNQRVVLRVLIPRLRQIDTCCGPGWWIDRGGG